MNSLKTFVHQIETFGTFLGETKLKDRIFKYYRIDTVTIAAVMYSKNGKIKQASFYYN